MNAPVFTLGHVAWAIAIASAYAAWSIVAKSLHLTGTWVTIIVLVGTATGGLAMTINAARSETIPSLTAIAILFLASLANGVAVYLQSMKVVDARIPTVSFITTIFIMLVVLTPIFNYFLNHEVMTPRQWLGIGSAIMTILILVS